MTLTAILLVLVSACSHAAWNFFGKKASPTASFFFLVMFAGGVLFSPVLLLNGGLIAAIDGPILWLLLATGIFQSVYLWGLAEAYRSGDMSIAYPIARSSPLIIVCVSALLLGQADSISLQAVLGIGAVVLGCLLTPLQRFGDMRLANYLNRTTGFALVAAFATAGYSLVDDQATRLMRELTDAGGDPLATPAQVALVYVCLQSFSSALCMAPFLLWSGSGRQVVAGLIRTRWSACLLTSVLMLGTYALVVLSMAFVSNVSYVVAFRQLSIPLGVMMAVVGFGESLRLPKVVGVLITVLGLIAVALG